LASLLAKEVWRRSGKCTNATNFWICERHLPKAVSNVSLGSGSFAEVRKAVDVETGDLRAIKVSAELDD
jgi:hypothetical protein